MRLAVQSLGDGAMTAEEATMAELERVLYAQMLILFAPNAVPAVAHVPLLLATLRSLQPALRKAAADTLRHLAGQQRLMPGQGNDSLPLARTCASEAPPTKRLCSEERCRVAHGVPCTVLIVGGRPVVNIENRSWSAERDPEVLLPARIETTLFGALDSETDSGTAAQLKATLRTLLTAGAQTRPSHYLAVCSAVILAATAVASVGAPANGGQAEALQGMRLSTLVW